MGVAFIVTYAAIASKYLTIAWNLSIAVTLVDYHPPILVRAIKSAVAATFGMVMFFVFPFCLSRSNNSS